MPLRSPSGGLGDESQESDVQATERPISSSIGQSPISPSLSMSIGAASPSNVSVNENRLKRARTEDVTPKKAFRKRMACQSCRIRKVKCDNARPTCTICSTTGSDCVYIETARTPVVDPTTQLMLDRLDQILTGVNGISTNIHMQESSPRTYHSANIHDSLRSHEQLDTLSEGSRDYLKIPSCKTTADSALTWPVFGGSFSQDALIGTIFSSDESSEEETAKPSQRLNSSSAVSDTYQVPGGLQYLPDERIPVLIDRFLECVHTKNPLLDVNSLVHHGRKAAENGLGWDAHSCLILITCALGAVAYPFDPKAGDELETNLKAPSLTSSTMYSRELSLAESCYVLALRRLGLLKHTLLGAQCHFFTGVFLMYTFRPLPAWNHFCQASTFYQIHSKTISGPVRASSSDGVLSGLSTTQRRLEQSLYWSCFKSECEMRVELPLPQSSIADFEYTHMFPSPPSPPSNFAPEPVTLNNETTPDAVDRAYAKRWNEELSWYYYLTEVALRRISNRIMNTFYRKDHTSWLDITPLIPMAEEFEAQISNWSANLPVVMQYETGQHDGGVSASKELGWATANRLLEMKAWLYQPFLYYAIHSTTLILHAPENQALRRLVDAAMECNHNIIQNRSARHRHHGIWFDIRALVTAAVLLRAVIKSGNMNIPADWEESFTSIIRTLQFWEDESPDLKKARSVVEVFLVDSKSSMDVT